MMVAPLKISASVVLDASQVSTGTKVVRDGVESIGSAATISATKLQQLVETQVRLSTQAANTNQRAADIAAYGAELDRLRAKYNPLYAVIANYKAAVAEIRDVHRQGALSADEMTAALQRQRQAALASIDAIKGRSAMMSSGGSGGQDQFRRQNLSYQLFDIGQSSAGGMPLGMILAQQGPQIAQLYAGQGGVKAALQDLGSMAAGAARMISPVSAAVLTAGAAAAAALGMKFYEASKEAQKLEQVLASHTETVDRLKKQYGDLGNSLKSALPMGGTGYTDAQARNEISTLETALKARSKDLAASAGGFIKSGLLGNPTSALDDLIGTKGSAFQKQVDDLLTSVRAGKGDLGVFQGQIEQTFDELRKGAASPAALNKEMQRLSDIATDVFSVQPKFEPFQAEIAKLTLGLKEGNADLSDFASNVTRIGRLNGLQKVADEIILASKGTIELLENLREVRTILQVIDRENTRSGLAGQRETSAYVNQRDAQARIADQRFAAEQQLAVARTNAEKLAAIEAQVRANAVQDADKDGGLQRRIDRALQAERTRQAVEARDQALERSQAMQAAITQQRQTLALIGQTTAARESESFAEQQIAKIRDDAARKGVAIDEQEIAAIRQRADEYGKLAAAIEATTLLREQQVGNDRLRFQVAAAGRPDIEQERLLALYDTEAKIREIGVDPSGRVAADLRKSALETVNLNAQLGRTREAWQSVQQSAATAIDSIVDGLSSGNIKEALQGIASDVSKTFLDLAIKNPLKNALLGTNAGTLDDVGGLGGIVSRLFGGGDSNAVVGKALGTSVGSMAVTAGTVMLNGGISGLGGLLSQGVSAAANSNVQGLDSYRKATALIESGGNYGALGPVTANGDRAYGAYQVMGQNIAPWTRSTLGTAMTPGQFLSSPQAQDAVFDKYFGASVAKYGTAQDAASVWFSGRPLSRAANASDTLGTTTSAYVDKFNSALGRVTGGAGDVASGLGGLSNATGAAAKGLDGLGSGMNQFGQVLAQAQAAGNSGLASALGGLTSYGQSVFNSSGVFRNAIVNGYSGLFSSGGYTGDGAIDEPAGVVHKGEIVWSQADIARAGGTGTVEAMRLGKRGYAMGGVVDSYPAPKPIWSSSSDRSPTQAAQAPAGRNAHFTFNIAGAYSKDDMRAEAYAGMKQALDEFNDHVMPTRVRELNNYPRWG